MMARGWKGPTVDPALNVTALGGLARFWPGMVIVLAITAVLQASGLTRFIDQAMTGLDFRLFPRQASGQLVIVAVDQASIDALGVWPWPRGYHAAVLERVRDAGARRIAFDVTFGSRSDDDQDAQFAAALRAAGDQVALPVFAFPPPAGEGGTDEIVDDPLPEFADTAALASINIWPDGDGVVRRLPRIAEVAGRHLPFMATWLAEGSQTPSATGDYYLDFAIQPGSLPQVAYSDVLTGAFNPRDIAGRDVLIGATSIDLGDRHAVPIYASLPGPLLIALGYESLSQGRALGRLPPAIVFVVAAVIATVVVPLLVRSRIDRGVGLVALFLAALCAAHLGAYYWLAMLVDIGPPVVSLFLAQLLALTVRNRLQERRISVQSRSIIDRQVLIQTIFENTADGLLTADETGRIESVNPAILRIFGYGERELIGKNVSMLVPQPHRASHDQLIQAYLRTGTARIVGVGREVNGQHKDGRTFPLDIVVAEATLRGRLTFIASMRDLTKRREIEAALLQAQKLESVGLLAGGVAHDFNNLLTVILGNIDMAEAALGKDHPANQYIQAAMEAAERGAQLTSRLLGFSRHDSDGQGEADVNAIVTHLEPMLRRTLGENIDIVVRIDERLEPVSIDPAQLENALLNLVINARDAMPRGGQITISTSRAETIASASGPVAGPFAVVSVADTGTGIPPEIRDRILSPFFTTKGRGKGTGLGLSIIADFMKQIGGQLRIESDLDRGTAVFLYMPQRRLDTQPADLAAGEEPALPGGVEQILFVEDDISVRHVSAHMLRSLGYGVVECSDGASALNLIDEGLEFDLLLSDIILSGPITGMDLAAEVQRRSPRVAVLFASGYPPQDLADRGRLTAAAAVVHKPFSQRTLAMAVRDALDSGGTPVAAQAIAAPPETDHRAAMDD